MMTKKFLYILSIIVVAFFASCTPDKTNDPNSPSPTTDDRDKYFAYWNATENSSLVSGNTFLVNILKSTTSTSEIIINNFSGLNQPARASVNNNLLTIPYQQLGSIGFTKGSGSLIGTTINLTYTTTIGVSTDSYTATLVKQ